MEDLWVVGGNHRTGTSMMMRALGAGGMSIAHDPQRIHINDLHSDNDFQVNGAGLFEPLSSDLQHPDFPFMYTGKLIKILGDRIYKLPVGLSYHVVFMLRNLEEMRQSWQAAFTDESVHPLWRRRRRQAEAEALVQSMLDGCLARQDMQIIPVWYPSVINDPIAEFTRIQAAGWPIDPLAAAAIVDKNLYRFRLADLELGA